jgi:hypothetical protein
MRYSRQRQKVTDVLAELATMFVNPIFIVNAANGRMASLRGRWRSLVAHLHDTQGVAGSSPARPTNKIPTPKSRRQNPDAKDQALWNGV